MSGGVFSYPQEGVKYCDARVCLYVRRMSRKHMTELRQIICAR